MSAQNVLFDAPGPRARRRHAILTVVGLVLLVPVILLVTRRSKLPLMRVAIPALAGLSTMHALVPPHPGPLSAIGLLKADLGITLGLGVLIAIPTVVVAGPLFSRLAARWVPVVTRMAVAVLSLVAQRSPSP